MNRFNDFVNVGIYFTYIQNETITINHLIQTNELDSYPAYILFIFIGLGFISLILTLSSMYGISNRNRSLSLLFAVLWVLTVAINLVMFAILFLYYYLNFSGLRERLVSALQQSSSKTKKLLDDIQSKHLCCGINNKDDYKNLSLALFPQSCYLQLNYLNKTDINNTGLNNTNLLMNTGGCNSIVNDYITFQLWTAGVIICVSVFLQILAITSMCVLNQRHQKFDENKNFMISRLDDETLSNENVNNNNNNNIHDSCKTIDEMIEVTQI
ncbi:unnamed protein product [Rotaria magnacalcarata]